MQIFLNNLLNFFFYNSTNRKQRVIIKYKRLRLCIKSWRFFGLADLSADYEIFGKKLDKKFMGEYTKILLKYHKI